MLNNAVPFNHIGNNTFIEKAQGFPKATFEFPANGNVMVSYTDPEGTSSG